MTSDSLPPHSERPRSRRGGVNKRGVALFVAFAATLVFGGFLFVAGARHGHDGPCCAMAPPRFTVSIVDEDGVAIDGARIRISRHDTLTLADDSSTFGWLTYDLPHDQTYRVTLTLPRGWVLSDSSVADTVVYMDSTGAGVRFVLRRAG